MKKIFLSAALFLLCSIAFAQKKINEGTIIYQVEWQVPPQMAAMAANYPSEITVYFKGDSTVALSKSTMFSSKSILNAKTEYLRLLLDVPMMGKKFSVIFTPDDQEQMQEHWPDFNLEASSETKTIAGYKATKFNVTEKKGNTRFEAWFTKDIDMVPSTLTQFYNKSYGVPLQFNSFLNGMSIKALVKEIKLGAVPAGIFTGTKDYEEITLAQLTSMMGGGRK